MDRFYSIHKINWLRIILIVIVLVLFTSSAMTQPNASVKLSWLPNTEPNLSGYKIYYGEVDGGPYPNAVDMGKPNAVDGRIHGEVSGLECYKLYYFVCRAYNDLGKESENSAQVKISFDVPKVTTGVIIVPSQ